MASIEIAHSRDLSWNPFAGGEHAAIHHDGDDIQPQCFEIRCPASYVGRPHGHESDEVIFVLEGELYVVGETLEPGSSIFIPGGTIYQLDAGPQGARYVNFRPRRDMSLLSPTTSTPDG